MVKKKVYIWADADEKIGYGHFIRCLALVDMLKEDFDCTFFTKVPTEYQRLEVESVCRLVPLPNDESRFSLFLNLLKGNETVLLDNYFFTSLYQKKVKERGCKLVVLSPNDKHHYADVVLNFVETNPSHFSAEPYTRFCIGLEWFLLRPPFLEPVYKTANANMITISYGGTDQFMLTEKTISSLLKCSYDIHCICTSKVSKERRDALSKRNVTCHVDASAQEVADVLGQSNYAILSSSGICIEALSRYAKVFAGFYVDNQRLLYNVLLRSNYIHGLGDLNQFDFSRLPDILNEDKAQNKYDIDFSGLRNRYLQLFNDL